MKFYTRLDRPSRIYWSAAFETAPLYRRRKSARIDRSLSQTTLLWWRINATVYIYIPICLQPARKNSSQKRWPSYHFCLCGNLVKVDFPRNPSRTKPNCLLFSTDKEVAFLKIQVALDVGAHVSSPAGQFSLVFFSLRQRPSPSDWPPGSVHEPSLIEIIFIFF